MEPSCWALVLGDDDDDDALLDDDGCGVPENVVDALRVVCEVRDRARATRLMGLIIRAYELCASLSSSVTAAGAISMARRLVSMKAARRLHFVWATYLHHPPSLLLEDG